MLRHVQGLRQHLSGRRVNKDRKNLATACKWGQAYLEGFPEGLNPFLRVERFAEERQPRGFMYYSEHKTLSILGDILIDFLHGFR